AARRRDTTGAPSGAPAFSSECGGAYGFGHQGSYGTPAHGLGIVGERSSIRWTGRSLTAVRGYSSPGPSGHSATRRESHAACAASTPVEPAPPMSGFEHVPCVVWMAAGSLLGSPPPSSTLPCQQLISCFGSGLE